jgi:hypothetical protein
MICKAVVAGIMPAAKDDVLTNLVSAFTKLLPYSSQKAEL